MPDDDEDADDATQARHVVAAIANVRLSERLAREGASTAEADE